MKKNEALRVEAIRHLWDASKHDLPLNTELRRHLELVKNAIIFFEVLGGMHLQWALFLSRAARARPQVLEGIKICFKFA